MKRTERQETIVEYRSEVLPNIVTTNPNAANVIEWADAHPNVWKIVSGTRSRPFGKNASTYMGCERGDGQELDRAAYFRREWESAHGIFRWRAAFTLEHYGDKGFKGGFFQQHDAKYPRGCIDLDYTPATLGEVLAQFRAWCGSTFETVRITVDKKVVWEAAKAVSP